MSTFTDKIRAAAHHSPFGLGTGQAADLEFTSWRDIHSRAHPMAGHLQRVGLRPHGRIAILATDPTMIASLIQAVWMSGASFTMLQQPSPQADLTEWERGCFGVLAMLDVKHLVVGEPFAAMRTRFEQHGLTVLDLAGDWGHQRGSSIDCAEGDIAILQLTSGSTSSPKAVAISHGNLDANISAMVTGSACDAQRDVMVSWLPLSHDMGLIGFLMMPMSLAIKAVCVSPVEFMRSPMNWLQMLSKQRGTITAAPNFAYSLAQRKLARVDDGTYDLSSLRFALCGAEPIDPDTMRAFAKEAARFGMPETAIVSAYGMAEATLAISFSPLGSGIQVDRVDREQLATAGSATAIPASRSARELMLLGPALPGTEICVRDPDGATLPARQVGELAIRGKGVTASYVTEQGAVSATDKCGWLSTGDLGYLTEHAEIAICGRIKNVVIVSGRNIYPVDVERAAETIDGVRQGGAVAFGVAQPGRPEQLWVAVEITDKSCDHDAVREAVANKVFQLTNVSPKVLALPRNSVPKTPSGKLRHTEAKRLFADTHS